MGKKLILIGQPSIGSTIEAIIKEQDLDLTVVVQDECMPIKPPPLLPIGTVLIKKLTFPGKKPSPRNLRRKKERELKKKKK